MKEAHKKKRSAVATDMSTICEQLYSYTFFLFFVLSHSADCFHQKPSFFASLWLFSLCVSVFDRVPLSVYKRLFTFFLWNEGDGE